jgi:hypothetical protein
VKPATWSRSGIECVVGNGVTVERVNVTVLAIDLAPHEVAKLVVSEQRRHDIAERRPRALNGVTSQSSTMNAALGDTVSHGQARELHHDIGAGRGESEAVHHHRTQLR